MPRSSNIEGGLRVRAARRSDAHAISRLVDEFNRHVGSDVGAMSARIVVRDGFGPRAPVRFIVAERGGAIVGYAACCDVYETEFGARGLYLIDLYVVPARRGAGTGRELIAAVAARAKQRKLGFMWWTSLANNRSAHAVYRSVGAAGVPMRSHVLRGPALAAAARRQPDDPTTSIKAGRPPRVAQA